MDQFKALFLPVGYPETVKDNYIRYSTMGAATNFLISINMTMSSAMLLYAVGLGNAAVPMAGALNWVIKDGVGQAGVISSRQVNLFCPHFQFTYCWWLGKRCIGS